MSSMETHFTLKKTYFYNFFPSKSEEDAPPAMQYYRTLIEIRDIRPAPVIDLHQPWQMKKTLSHFEISTGKIVVNFNDTFEFILRYWTFIMAKHLTIFGHRVAVVLWDVTNEKQPRMYQGNNVYVQIIPNENYALTCIDLMRERNMKVDDYIGLYWDSRRSFFIVKLFSSSMA